MNIKERFLFETEVLLSDAGVLRADRINIRFQLIRIMTKCALKAE